jgi:hypothetical protein
MGKASGNVSGNRNEVLMARSASGPSGVARRVARHRERLARSATRRVEVTVPIQDVEAVRRLAALLRAGGEGAANARDRLGDLLPRTRTRSGGDLVAFFRASPLVGLELELERDRSPGRDVAV